ncbi:uncharacterized protein C2845_PM01G37600 [Panicum miliaceum]|uniref:Uncharacterized protein n=1 Tax=Panicum miliaceum TaxID=4540 RepID=A0A3L6TRQ8_PANMI|nr:uncharacterized protein C2845_PM01G37600 [Panicum miliaceum]
MHLTLSPARTARKAAAAAHARSASEPCHPALARLEGTVRALRVWSCCCGGAARSSSSSSGYGLALLEAVLIALGETLATPRAAAALRDAGDQALDGFLALADAYGTFGSALLAARQSVTDARAGARRWDGAAVAASARARRRTEKELRHLAAAMRHASRHAAVAPGSADAEVISVVAEATVAVAEASVVIFSRCAAMSPDVSAVSSRKVAGEAGRRAGDQQSRAGNGGIGIREA